MERIRIHLLGGFLVERGDRSLPPIPSLAGRSLFAYLVTHRNRRHTRDLLVGTFWPDQPESAGRRRLSQTLWQIQTALQEAGRGVGLIQTTASDVTFSSLDGYWIDVAEFDGYLSTATALEAAGTPGEVGALEAAVDLYRGEFLAGFYDDWALIERQRLRGGYLSALQRLVALHKSRSDYETALSFARRLTLHDPLREKAHREVMRLCFLLGRTNEALQQFDRCVAVLAEELGDEPAVETRELRASIAQLRDKGEVPFAPTVQAPLLDLERRIPLVGRERERAVVLRDLEETLGGTGGVVLVEGPSGIGKTRLLQELAEDAQWRGLSVLSAECREDEQLHAFQAIRSTLESGVTRLRAEQLGVLLHDLTLADLAWIVPKLREWLPGLPSPPALERGDARERIRRSIRETLIALAQLNPTVVLIDDVQWADDESMGLLAEISSELQHYGLLLCLSYRGEEARDRTDLWGHLVAIDGTARAERVELTALDLTESTRLVEQSLGLTSVPTDMSEGLFLETGGNPLFLLETLRTWHEETRDRFGVGPGPTEIVAGETIPVAGGITQVITRRFAGLDVDARTVLEVAAIQGRLSDPDAVAAIAGLSRIATLKAIETLIRRGALVESDNGYAFAHYQIRKVSLDGLESDRRMRLHHDVATVIERRDPDRVEELAYHFIAAGVADKAALYSLRAGKRAMSLAAFETAARHFENATPWDSEIDRFELLTHWERALDVLGRRTEQHRVLAEAVTLAASPAEHVQVAARRARLLANEGNYRDAVSMGEEAVDATSPDVPDRYRMLALQTLGTVLSQSGRPADAIPYLEAAVSVAREDDTAEAAALCDLGNVLGEAHRYEDAAERLTDALGRYERIGDLYGTADASGLLAIVRMEQGEPELAAEMYRKAIDLARDLGYRRGEAVNLANLGNALYVQGSIPGALACYDEAATVFAGIGDRRGGALLRANAASVRHTMLGDDSVEADVIASLEFFAGEEHHWGEAFCHEHLAAIALRRGDRAAASKHVGRGLALLGDNAHRWVEVHLRRLAAEIALEDGDPDEARAHVVRAGTLCRDLGLTDVAPTVHSVLAVVELSSGNAERALEVAVEATAMLEKGSERPYVVWFRRYSAALGAGARDDATESLMTAVRLLDEVMEPLDAGVRATALSAVRVHREIMEAREHTLPVIGTVALPRADVPIGRPLRDDEWVEVRWTVSAPADLSVRGAGERRRLRVRRLVTEAAAQGGAPRVEDLAAALNVSVVTMRRDLAKLRRAGAAVPTRGRR